jgi:hypothetical protein
MDKVEFLEGLLEEIDEMETVAQVKELIQNKIEDEIEFIETMDLYKGEDDDIY